MLQEIAQIRRELPPGARIAFVSGNFNIVHPGHLRLLKFAADAAEILVVGLNPDSHSGVTVPSAMRLEGLNALTIVDHACLLSEEPAQFIAKLKPDFVVKGKEFEGASNPEAAVVEGYGGKLVFSSGDVQFASMDLIKSELAPTPQLPLLQDAEGYPQRHGLQPAALEAVLQKMSGLRVAIVGDIIIDDYITCDPLGMSQEDPTIVVSPMETKTFVGGAGIVAAHARSLGASAFLFTAFGADDTATYAQKRLGELDVKVRAVMDETRPTTRKQRYRALDKTLLRVNHLRQHDISKDLAERLLKEIVSNLSNVDLLMFADFNYGCLPQELVVAICEAARAKGVPTTADSQASSQMADIARFKGMTLVTPTEREARLALRDTASGLAVLASSLQDVAAAKNVVITLGQDGMMIHGQTERGQYMTDRLPALNATPKDVSGAGDSLFTTASMALCTGANIWLAAYLGGIAAAVQVSRLGNEPLKAAELISEIKQIKP